jgi:integrase/recombinase XerC
MSEDPITRALQPLTPTVSTSLVTGDRRHTADTILAAWSAGKSPNTLRSYRHDLEDFARFLSTGLGIVSPLAVEPALDRLFREDSARAHGIVLDFRASLLAANLAPASINRALATLRSVSKLARMLGLMTWVLEVPGVKPERRRDTRGPAVDDVRRMLAATSADSEVETRDAAIIVTLFCLGLRVSELCGLTLEETDLARGSAWIRGKGRRERELVPLPATVVAAVRRYLVHRGATGQGPLFVRHVVQRRQPRLFQEETVSEPRRLNPRSVLRIVAQLGARCGFHAWPHGLRHAGVSAAIERSGTIGLTLDQVRAFSRHASVSTLVQYHDEHDRTGVQRKLTNAVADALL